MKVWINAAGRTCIQPIIAVHWTEPHWMEASPTPYWRSTKDYIWLDNDVAMRAFKLKKLPEGDECWEIDLSVKPKVVCVWVPA